MNPYFIIAWLLTLPIAYLYGSHNATQEERTACELRITTARAEAAESARQTEHQQQQAINDALREQNEDLASVNAGLASDLEWLRSHRPSRPLPGATPSQAAGAACTGVDGTALSAEDAGFLVGEAARADRIRIALRTCYSAYDAIGGE